MHTRFIRLPLFALGLAALACSVLGSPALTPTPPPMASLASQNTNAAPTTATTPASDATAASDAAATNAATATTPACLSWLLHSSAGANVR